MPSKHSVVVQGRKTSVSLEEPFWDVLREAAQKRQISVSQLITAIDGGRGLNNLSSALRLFALDFCRQGSRRVPPDDPASPAAGT